MNVAQEGIAAPAAKIFDESVTVASNLEVGGTQGVKTVRTDVGEVVSCHLEVGNGSLDDGRPDIRRGDPPLGSLLVEKGPERCVRSHG